MCKKCWYFSVMMGRVIYKHLDMTIYNFRNGNVSRMYGSVEWPRGIKINTLADFQSEQINQIFVGSVSHNEILKMNFL
jgi:hypothetical protein